MIYTINGTDLSTLGVLPIQSGNLIAVPGIFDFPGRKGATERSWGIEIEAFVSAADLEWESRGITFNALIEAASRAQLLTRIHALSTLLKQDRLTFVTPYRTVNVVADGEMTVDILDTVTAKVSAALTEQTVSFASLTEDASGGAGYLLDGYNLENDFGIVVKSSSGLYSTSERIEVNTTANYTRTGYRKPKDITLQCVMVQASLSVFGAALNQFQALLASPGMKVLSDLNGVAHNVYAKDGFQVYFNQVIGGVVASFALKLRAL